LRAKLNHDAVDLLGEGVARHLPRPSIPPKAASA
jgi:hypothetical protein